jgi:hypothetical protein
VFAVPPPITSTSTFSRITKELNLIEILPPTTIATSGTPDDENSGEYLGIQKNLSGRLLWH